MRGSLLRILKRRVIAVATLATVMVIASACSSDAPTTAPAPAGPSADVDAPPQDDGDAETDESYAGGSSAALDSEEASEVEPEDRMTMATLVPNLPGPHVAIVVDDRICDGSPCPTVLELQADGQWSLLAGDGTQQAGGFDSQELNTLATMLEVDDVVLGPFTGQCPTESGGSERFYRVFSMETGAEEEPVLDVSTCSHRIDADAPIVVALDLLLAEVLNS